MAIFIKLFVINIVASNFLGLFKSACKRKIRVPGLWPFSGFNCVAFKEKKATSEPEINADPSNNTNKTKSDNKEATDISKGSKLRGSGSKIKLLS